MSDTATKKVTVEEENEGKTIFKLREKSWWDNKHVVLDLYGEVLEVLDELDY